MTSSTGAGDCKKTKYREIKNSHKTENKKRKKKPDQIKYK
jgi:hypothetical protein